MNLTHLNCLNIGCLILKCTAHHWALQQPDKDVAVHQILTLLIFKTTKHLNVPLTKTPPAFHFVGREVVDMQITTFVILFMMYCVQ